MKLKVRLTLINKNLIHRHQNLENDCVGMTDIHKKVQVSFSFDTTIKMKN